MKFTYRVFRAKFASSCRRDVSLGRNRLPSGRRFRLFWASPPWRQLSGGANCWVVAPIRMFYEQIAGFCEMVKEEMVLKPIGDRQFKAVVTGRAEKTVL